MALIETAEALVALLEDQGRLIQLPGDRTTVFVGDTHGDLDATERILDRYPTDDVTLVFLGDAVDRGANSPANLQLILQTKRARPESVYLLMGNHEAWSVEPFSPADFWNELNPQDAVRLADSLSHLPFAALHPSGVLALHGALPNLSDPALFRDIELGSTAWRAVTWGDWHEESAHATSVSWGRPSFGREDFEARAGRLGIRVLVRSHQPFAPLYLYDDRCLTIFSSCAYGNGPRRVAVLRPGADVRTARDLILEDI
jgi:hypothetical protein